MRHIFMTVIAAACLLMNAAAGAETPPADNAIKSVRQDLTRFEQQAKGLSPSRKANIKRMQRLVKITRGRLNSSPNKTHPSWIETDARLSSLEKSLETMLADKPPAPAPAPAPARAAAPAPAPAPSTAAKPPAPAAAPPARQQATSPAARKPAPSNKVEPGSLTSYQKNSVLQHLGKQDRRIFDGKNFVAGVPFPTIRNYYRSYGAGFKKAVQAWNTQISPSRKNTADGIALRNQLVSAKKWGDAMIAAIKPLEQRYNAQVKAQGQAKRQMQQQAQAATAANKQACRTFSERAMVPNNREPMTRLILQKMHNNQQIVSVEGVKKHQEVAKQVTAVCSSIDRKALGSSCYFSVGSPERLPKNWCDAAQNSAQLIAAAAINHAKKHIKLMGAAKVQTPAQLKERDGWLTYERPVTFKEKMFFGPNAGGGQMDRVNTLLAAAGAKISKDELWGEQKQNVDALRKAVVENAGKWKTPPEKLKNYSSALAKEEIINWHPDAKVLTAYISRKGWKVHKNALGVILRRTMPGYVLFKLKDDPLCQLRSYTLTETYVGAGKFAKASGVRFGYVRFQKCS